MKFSCPKCSAKYQIADDKVAGRTVKMKCRKCGTTIPIQAEPSERELARAPLVRADSLKPSPSPPRRTGTGGAGTTQEAPVPEIATTQVAEWHAGIDGKAVGPMTLHEFERRIGEGSIHEETFVWREGMDGWKQIPDVPELFPILQRSIRPMAPPPPSMPMQAKQQAARPVPAPTVPKPTPAVSSLKSPTQPVASHPKVTESGRSAGSAPRVSAPMAPAATHGANALATAQAADAAPRGWAGALEGLEDPKVKPDPTPSPRIQEAPVAPVSSPLAAGEAPIPHIDMPTPSERGIRPSYDSLVMQLQKTRKQHPLVVPFAVLAAVVFGVTIGFVVFGDQKTKIVKQVIEVPAKSDEKGEQEVASGDAARSEESGETAGDDAPAESGKTASGSGTGKTKANSGTSGSSDFSSKEVKGLQGLSGLEGLGGPSAGPAGPSASSGGGQPLSSSQIQSTVAKYQTSVKRGCWERALMARDKDAPSSARVTVSISVASSGAVTGATSSGDPRGYTGLSSCITRRVRGWQFPRSSGSTTVNVPFVFAAQ